MLNYVRFDRLSSRARTQTRSDRCAIRIYAYVRAYTHTYILCVRAYRYARRIIVRLVCAPVRATMRNDLKFIGMYVNYFNYYTAVKG